MKNAQARAGLGMNQFYKVQINYYSKLPDQFARIC